VRAPLPRPGTSPAVHATKEIETAEKVLHRRYWIGSCQWWIAEYDPATGLAYGYPCLGDPAGAEWGYLDLNDLEAIDHGGRIVRRDLHRPPTRAHDAHLPGT